MQLKEIETKRVEVILVHKVKSTTVRSEENMKFDNFLDDFNKNRKIKLNFDNIKKDFIEKGYEKFLFLSYSKEKDNEEKVEKLIESYGKSKVPSILLPVINTILCEHSNNFLTMFFSYSPTKRYYLAKEIARRAHKNVILPNLYDDDPSINHMVIFKKNQMNDALLLANAIRTGGARGGLPAYSIFGVDILYIVDLCEINNIRICFPKPNPLTHFCGNMTRRDNDPYLIKQTRETIEEITKRTDFENEFEISFTLRKFLMEKIQSIYISNRKFFDKELDKGTLDFANNKEKLERIYSDLVSENKAPVKWKSEMQLFNLVYSVFPDTLFQHKPDWLTPQSLDIYVPSKRLAFEYQGIQHFQKVDFFGGEKALKHRKQLDDKKRRLCKKNGIKLIEWHYQDTITKSMLRKKLKEEISLNI